MVKCSQIAKQKVLKALCVILSPLLIVCIPMVFIFYLLLIIPLKSISLIIFQKKYNRNRLARASQQKLEIQQHQMGDLMFPFKPFPNLDMYISIASGYLILTNSELVCMCRKPLQYYFQPGQTEQFCYYLSFEKYKYVVQETSLTLQPGWTQSTCIYNNNLYIVIFDNVFILSNLELFLVARIPDYNLFMSQPVNLNFSAQIFSFNNYLYVHNNSSKLFQITQNKLKCVNTNQNNVFYAQFCDHVFVFQFNKVQKLKCIFELELVQDIRSSRLLFCSGAIAILVVICEWERKYESLYIVNMLDGCVKYWLDTDHQFIQMDADQVHNEQINKDALELDQTGFKIKDQIIDQILGIEFRKRVSDYRKTYECKQKTVVNANQMHEFVFKAELELILEPQFKRTINTFRLLSETIQNQLQETNNAVKGLVEIQNQMVQIFNFMYEENELNSQ
ncbi:Conserved_hypothetical protein [Hexamita inflata]|uniref:Transmembrane protein n=1 Tax=Hexamita inflata TaxID=28002 RepID=A0AA86TYC4_9EUKA|nr:Conserved hypothetical protein [Hexamita inflata]